VLSSYTCVTDILMSESSALNSAIDSRFYGLPPSINVNPSGNPTPAHSRKVI
jgi:hypothetical protein